ncbi:MAG: translation initiation factor [Verrucomicrobia bacterium]|nr:translation initiation factor [Verrucomicrobiota bacterium]
MSNGKISTEGGQGLQQNPFAALSAAGLPSFAKASAVAKFMADKSEGTPVAHKVERDKAAAKAAGNPSRLGTTGSTAPKNRGRVDIRRETGGRGGKTVTVVEGFVGIGLPEKEQLVKKMRAACGCGGTVKDGEIVIQGDQRETVARILSEAGFRPVMAGG